MATATTPVVMTERASMPRDTTATTPRGVDDVAVIVQPAALRILIRAARTGLQTFVAVVLGGAVAPTIPIISDALPPGQFGEKMLAALYVAGVAMLISAAQNAAELLAEIDANHPSWRS